MIELTTLISDDSTKTATILLDPDEDAMHPYMIKCTLNGSIVQSSYAGSINSAEDIADDFVRG